MQSQQQDKNNEASGDVQKTDGDKAAERGKVAIDAGNKKSGTDPEQKKEEEKKDAEQWRNEG